MLSDRYVFGPKDSICAKRPLLFITVDGLEQQLMHFEMWAFGYTVCLRVVARNADMLDVVLLCKVFKGDDEGSAIVITIS